MKQEWEAQALGEAISTMTTDAKEEEVIQKETHILDRVSSWERLVRTVAKVRMSISIWRLKVDVARKAHTCSPGGAAGVQELRKSEEVIARRE